MHTDKTKYSIEDENDYFKNVLVKEQPFYRKGMSNDEIRRELEYLGDNLISFYEGGYIPLWRQNQYK